MHERPRYESEELKRQLGHVYWVGGGSGAGKSTIARRLAKEHGFTHYSTDDVMAEHVELCMPEDCPELTRFLKMDMDERWLYRSPESMLETFHWFRGEGFDLIVDDLLQLSTKTCVIAEGFRLLPNLVQPLLSDRNHAVFLLPSPGFRELAFASRNSMWDIANKTSNPEAALHNLLERDRMFTDRLREQTRELGLLTIEVDVSQTADNLAARVGDALGLGD